MRTSLVVLGAPHSGGDGLAAALARCGAQRVPRGRIRALCDAVLQERGIDWPEPAGLQLFEEPRLCLLLPALRGRFQDPVCIHVHRNPLEVAHAMQVEAGLSIEDGLALWEAYNASALQASEGLARVFVAREDLVSRPRACIEKLLLQLGGLGVEGLAVPAGLALEGLVDSRPSDMEATTGSLGPAQEALWRRLASGMPAGDSQVAELKSRSREQASEIDILNQRVAWLDAQVLGIEASHSWRITAPLRAISTQLGRLRAAITPGKRPVAQGSRAGARPPSILEGEDTFVLYRIIGNDLHPRHKRGQAIGNLEFILEHEPALDGCAKRFVLNRILDGEQEQAIMRMLEQAGFEYLRIPFDAAEYAKAGFDTDVLPEPGFLYGEAFDALDDAAASRLRGALYRHKNNYVMNNNGARNVALDDGRGRAKWIMPWDGNCFLTREAWDAIRQGIANAPANRYFVVPMARMQNNDQLIRGGRLPEAVEEPQVVFRRDAVERFDTAFCYGRRPKVELLWRLGVRGPWDDYADDPWDRARPCLSPDAGAVGRAGWVARLSSGMHTLEANTGHAPLHRGHARSGAILATLRQLDASLAGADPERPTSLRPRVLQREVARQDAPPLQDLVQALLRTADGIIARPADRAAGLQRAFDDSVVLALAWSFTAGGRYAQRGSAILDHVTGAEVGTGCDGIHHHLDAVRLFERAGCIAGRASTDSRAWLAARLEWLSTSPEAISERRADDHRGHRHDLQVASIAAFLDDRDLVYDTLVRAQSRIGVQFDADGRPRCATMAASMHQACIGMQGWIDLSDLALQWGVDLWSHRAPDGANLGQAARWLLSRDVPALPSRQADGFDHERLEPIRFAARGSTGALPGDGGAAPSPYAVKPLFPPDCGIRPFWNLASHGRPGDPPANPGGRPPA